MSGTTWPALVAGAKAKASEVESKFDWIEGDVVPMTGGTKTDATYDLGESGFRWRDGRFSRNLYVATSVNIANTTATANVFLNITTANAGTVVAARLFNTSNTAGASSQLQIICGGATAADVSVQFEISGGVIWTMGLDNSDSDKFKISSSSTLGASDLITLTTVGVLILSTASVGAAVSSSIINTDNTNVLSDAKLFVSVGGASAGDAYINLNNSVVDFVVGIDNSDSDKFKISQAGTLGTNDSLVITTAGEITMPLQPAFLAYNSADDTDVLGGATTSVTVEFDTEVFDQGSDYNNVTDTFTAPVTGRYLLILNVRFNDVIDSTVTRLYIQFVTSNRTYDTIEVPNGTALTDQSFIGFSVVADMDTNDTASVIAVSAGGTKIIDITNGAVTSFSGCLLA